MCISSGERRPMMKSHRSEALPATVTWAEVPLFVAGGFGGCGRVIAVALEGALPTELTINYQVEHSERYADLLETATSEGQTLSFNDMAATFAAAGVEGLRNGLDERDNRRLLVTDDIDEVVALVLRGLRRDAEAR
jgi:hypothetical protein